MCSMMSNKKTEFYSSSKRFASYDMRDILLYIIPEAVMMLVKDVSEKCIHLNISLSSEKTGT